MILNKKVRLYYDAKSKKVRIYYDKKKRAAPKTTPLNLNIMKPYGVGYGKYNNLFNTVHHFILQIIHIGFIIYFIRVPVRFASPI